MEYLVPSLDVAREVVLRTQDPDIASLRAQLDLGHAAAARLIEQLQAEHTVLRPWPQRQPGIHPDHRRVHVQNIRGDARLEYNERVAQLALFYFELAEEDSNAHSAAVIAQLPVTSLPWATVQELFRKQWYGERRLGLTEAALAFHEWLVDQQLAPAELGGVEAGIREICLPYERPFAAVTDSRALLDRYYVRLARFFRRALRENFSQHSRSVEWFVPNALVPQNQKLPGLHPEHVVPCAVLRDLATACYADHWSVRQVAELLRTLLVLIWIGQADRKMLDDGPSNLRSSMPPGWQHGTGCGYARLHAKSIQFTPAPGYPCRCGAHVPNT